MFYNYLIDYDDKIIIIYEDTTNSPPIIKDKDIEIIIPMSMKRKKNQ